MIELDSRKVIFMGVDFMITHMPDVSQRLNLDFQSRLMPIGIEFQQTQLFADRLLMIRHEPSPLAVNFIKQPDTPPGMGQVVIVAEFPKYDLSTFCDEADKIVDTFLSHFSFGDRQVISKDATIRSLYSTGGVHAYQAIWETLLGQSNDKLRNLLGKPMLGGGLRFVIPAEATESDPASIELKIESFLQDSFQLFVETQIVWGRVESPGSEFSPRRLLQTVEDYNTDVMQRMVEMSNHE
jgi:hypothetical protein